MSRAVVVLLRHCRTPSSSSLADMNSMCSQRRCSVHVLSSDQLDQGVRSEIDGTSNHEWKSID